MDVLKIPRVPIDQLDKTDNINYEVVNECAKIERQKGMHYLKKIINL